MKSPKRPRGRGQEPAGPPRAARVGDLLGGVLRELGIEEEVARQGILERWPALVGPRIAAVARASAISGDTLFVQVESSPWINELHLMRQELLRRLNAPGEDGPRVERIIFSLRGEDAPPGMVDRHQKR